MIILLPLCLYIVIDFCSYFCSSYSTCIFKSLFIFCLWIICDSYFWVFFHLFVFLLYLVTHISHVTFLIRTVSVIFPVIPNIPVWSSTIILLHLYYFKSTTFINLSMLLFNRLDDLSPIHTEERRLWIFLCPIVWYCQLTDLPIDPSLLPNRILWNYMIIVIPILPIHMLGCIFIRFNHFTKCV